MKNLKTFENFDDNDGDFDETFEHENVELREAAQRRFDSTIPTMEEFMDSDDFDYEAEIEYFKKMPNVSLIASNDQYETFIPDSIVITPEDHPMDLCYYTPDGIKLSPIVMEKASGVLLDKDSDDFFDVNSFKKWYDGYETSIVSIKID